MRNRLRNHILFMQSTARLAGAIMRAHWKKPVAIKRKPDQTLVSEVDLKISKQICQRVRQNYPTYGLLTEESFHRYRPASRGFIVDELDGTRTYLTGGTGFTFQMAYFEDYDQVMIGLIYDPIQDIMIWGCKGGKVNISINGFVQTVPAIQVASVNDLRYGHHRHRFNSTLWQIYQHLSVQPEQIVSTGSIGSKAMDLILGKFEVILGPHRHIPVWDWAAGSVLARNLGFEVCHFEGSDLHMSELNTPHPFGYLICPQEHKAYFLEKLSSFLKFRNATKEKSLISQRF